MPRFLDLYEAAQMLGLDPTEVTELAFRGSLAASRCGRSWLFELRDVSRYLRSVEGC